MPLGGGNLFTRHKEQRQVLPWDSNQRYETDAKLFTFRSNHQRMGIESLSYLTMINIAHKGGAIHRVQPFPFKVPMSIHSPQRDMSLHCRGTILGPPCPIGCPRGLCFITRARHQRPLPNCLFQVGTFTICLITVVMVPTITQLAPNDVTWRQMTLGAK